jgi:hypothetical protein
MTSSQITRDSVALSLRHAGGVERYHTWPMIHKQRVDAHSWQVMRLYRELFGWARPAVWEFMLLHDVAEIQVGDVPSYIKFNDEPLKAALGRAEIEAMDRAGVKLPELTELEFAQFKLCDILDRWEYALVEFTMGNRHAEPIMRQAELEIDKWVDKANAREVYIRHIQKLCR